MIRKFQEEISIIQRCREDFKVFYYVLLAAMIAHLFFIFLFYAIDVPVLSVFNLFSVIFYIFGLKLFVRSLIQNDFGLLVWLITVEIILHAYLASYYMGLASGFQYYILTLTAYPLFTKNSHLILSVLRLWIIVAAYIFIEAWLDHATPIVKVNQNTLQMIRYANLSCFILFSGSISFAFVKGTRLNQDALIAMATFDKLTGLNNRYSLETFTEANVVQSKQTGKPLSMLIADIDFFKEINDQHGHLCGDYVLSKVADIMRSALRSQDVIGRWGGEEFMVILPDTDTTTLAMLAERLRLTMMKTVFTYANEEISITVTVGGATMVESDTVESLILRTDQALYQGKNNGRNCYYFKAA